MVGTLAALCRAQAPETPDNPTAYKALHAMAASLGRDALERVVEVTGQGGDPQPHVWKIVLKEGAGSREVEVQDGQVTAQRALTRPPAYANAVKLSDLNLDSSGAFDATDAQARKVKLRFDSLNYVLRVSDSTGKPVWYIELISKEGTGVGAIRVAAHDGAVLSTDGRLTSNPPPATPAVAAGTPRPTPRPAVATPPPPRIVASTPAPVGTPRRVTTTTTVTTTNERPRAGGFQPDSRHRQRQRLRASTCADRGRGRRVVHQNRPHPGSHAAASGGHVAAHRGKITAFLHLPPRQRSGHAASRAGSAQQPARLSRELQSI